MSNREAWHTGDEILLELLGDGYNAEIIMDIAARMGVNGIIWGESPSFDADDVHWPRPTEEELEKRARDFNEARRWYGVEQWDD